MKSWFCFFSNFLEILILGCGKQVEFVSPELRHFVRSLGMKLEAVDSVNPVNSPFWHCLCSSFSN